MLPAIYVLAASFTNIVFKDALILTVGPGMGAGRGGKQARPGRRSMGMGMQGVPAWTVGPVACLRLEVRSGRGSIWIGDIYSRERRRMLQGTPSLLTRCTCAHTLCCPPLLHNVPPQAPCPSCGTVNTTYFGDILTVSGESSWAERR